MRNALESYNGVVAFIKAYFYADPRVKSVLIGPSSRVIDEQRSNISYPYCWIESLTPDYVADESGHGVHKMWDIVLSVKGNAPLDHEERQEQQLQLTEEIIDDFLSFLRRQQLASVLLFSHNPVAIDERTIFEADDNWGWSVGFRLGSMTACAGSGTEISRSRILQAKFSAYEFDLAIDIDGNVFSTLWKTGEDVRLVLHRLKTFINEAQLSFSAQSSHDHLIILSSDIIVIDFNPVANEQAPWTEPITFA